MIKSLAHKGKITEEECRELLDKIDGHDVEIMKDKYACIKEIRDSVYNKGYENGKRAICELIEKMM